VSIIIVVGVVHKNKEMFLIVEDFGIGYNYSEILNKCSNIDKCVDTIKECGRGILIVKSLCDNVKFNRQGNKIVILKKLKK
jgi:serine/threonine-protein kinase RsbW